MPKVSPITSNFAGGEFSPQVQGRVDSERYPSGLATCVNSIPTQEGGWTRRPGSKQVAEVKTSSLYTRLLKFEFSRQQAYVIEAGRQYARFYKNNGPILSDRVITGITKANPAVVTAAAHEYVNGASVTITGVVGMTQVNGLTFTVANATTNTFELQGTNSTAYSVYTSGGVATGIYEITMPYLETEWESVKYVQSLDTLYLCHPNYSPRKLGRVDHDRWTLTTVSFLDGPYLAENSTSTTLAPGATTGSGIALVASAALFVATDVGRVVRIKHGTTDGWAKITAFVSATQVTISIQSDFGAITAVKTWKLGLYSTTTGFPVFPFFYEDRLGFGGAAGDPDRVDLSCTSDFENFAPSKPDDTVPANFAVAAPFNTGGVNAALWAVPSEKGLFVGTAAGIYVVRANSLNAALSPTDVAARLATVTRSGTITPIRAGKSAVFVASSGKRLYEIGFFIDVDGVEANDLSVFARHATSAGVRAIDYQAEPVPIVWCVRNDGVVAGMTFERGLDNLRVSWHRHVFGGKSNAGGDPAKIESVCVISDPTQTFDQAWFVGQWFVNGQVKRYVVYLEKMFDQESWAEQGYFVDCGLSRDTQDSQLFTITNVTKAATAVVTTSVSHGFANGIEVFINRASGMTELNGRTFTTANVTATTFELRGETSSAYATYASGGVVTKNVSTVSGLSHLEGETVAILGNGAPQQERAISGGAVAISPAAGVLQVGFPFDSDVEPLRWEAGAADGTSFAKTRRVHRVGMLIYRTRGLLMGPTFTTADLKELPLDSSESGDVPPPLISGMQSFECPENDYDFDGRVCIRVHQPVPATILAIAPQYVVQDRG